MNLDNLINDNGVYLYKDDSFQTIFTQLHFLAERGNREDAICDILCKYLMASNKIYNSDTEIRILSNTWRNFSFMHAFAL